MDTDPTRRDEDSAESGGLGDELEHEREAPPGENDDPAEGGAVDPGTEPARGHDAEHGS